ncbi:MAG TPA: 16S rRNA (cytosine(1402)-N(4))-methyltransferase, partial [Syntrophomonas sp.]|nr:16S rRNA (cytosine(1402)-N(4))-methyltransferase [Syntrophomonas sp.]
VCEHHAELEILSRKPIIASQAECLSNPRSRSAKLRAARKL